MAHHLERHILIHVCKDKTLSYRTRRERIFNGRALPVFSVDSEEEAASLIRLVGRKQYDRHPQEPDRDWYKITLTGEADFRPYLEYSELDLVTEKLAKAYEFMKKTPIAVSS